MPTASWRSAPTCRSSATLRARCSAISRPRRCAGRPLLVQRLLRLARRDLAFQRPGAAGAGLPRRHALRLRHGLGAFLRHRRHARRLDQPRHLRHLPGRHHHPADQADRCRPTNEAALEIFFRNSRFPEQNVGDMRALMASAELGVRRVDEILGPLRRRRRGRRAAPACSRARASSCATRLAETFDYGTHRFTDAIDSDGHGNGPFHIRLSR